jgi:hypothetical protein
MERREKDLIDEIHERRARLMAQFDNDLRRYGAYLREREQRHLGRVVDQMKVVRQNAPNRG